MASSPSAPTSSASKAHAIGTSSPAPKITHAIPLTIVHPFPNIANVLVSNPTPLVVANIVSKSELSTPPKENPPKQKRKMVDKIVTVSTNDESLDDPIPPPKSRKPTPKRRKPVAKPSAQAPFAKASSTQIPPIKESNPQGEASEPKKRKSPTKKATSRASNKTKQTFAKEEQAPIQSKQTTEAIVPLAPTKSIVEIEKEVEEQ